jgi:hypothetical protein
VSSIKEINVDQANLLGYSCMSRII